MRKTSKREKRDEGMRGSESDVGPNEERLAGSGEWDERG